jgi:hypothetical protein
VKLSRINIAAFCSILAMLLLCEPIVHGQSTSKISGTVFDATKGSIPRANVRLFGIDRQRETKSDDMGRFEFTGLPAGTYDLQIEAEGFATKTIEDIQLSGKDAGPFAVTLEFSQGYNCGAQPAPSYENSENDGATLVGLVWEYGGKPITNARVEMRGAARTLVTTSNDEGLYGFDGIEPGLYVLSVSHPEYSPLSTIRLWITRGQLARTSYLMILKGHKIECPDSRAQRTNPPPDTTPTRSPNQELSPPDRKAPR